MSGNNIPRNNRNNSSVVRTDDIQSLLTSEDLNLTLAQLEIFNQRIQEISFTAVGGSRSVSPMSLNGEIGQLETIAEGNPSDDGVSLGNISALTGLTAGMSMQGGMPNQDSSVTTPTSVVGFNPESQETEISTRIFDEDDNQSMDSHQSRHSQNSSVARNNNSSNER